MYADTSVFIAIYLPDNRRRQGIARLVRDFQPRFWLTPLHRAELSHAVYEQVGNKKLSANEARQVIAHFERDCLHGRWREVRMPDAAMTGCMALARKHGTATGASSADTLHVASALELRSGQFWTLDSHCAALAAAAGLAVLSAPAAP
ncbi:MAG: PIN domain-containing protein [Terriglobales bacterium]